MTFAAARPTRCFEDLEVGEFRRSPPRVVRQEEILEFARAYDPQWFHTDPEAARDSVFGEVVASGIHVLAMWRQMDHAINSDIDHVCGVGWDELRLKSAVRAGDEIHVTSEIVALTPSTTRSDRGTALTRYAVVKADGTEAVTFTSINLVYTREGRRRA
ncbi:MaoC/PaaZ C-terminal domain-containing protein [Croceicoccus sp. YJ47]|uniref:MaoC/PaaZ C-terminal domain-containing protein n=1 Tax=Croceicoccus sp. YJ47 TaxID=2798724 RepID=UPI0019211339|nr:MaoC/PaaZ C-terminal domain-containing protein [Croceicoccus sp. YJ47]QQN75114.1 MaoC family dehydratase N-terminal domain-containing protein [Croceicoccus sp. YJ47]